MKLSKITFLSVSFLILSVILLGCTNDTSSPITTSFSTSASTPLTTTTSLVTTTTSSLTATTSSVTTTTSLLTTTTPALPVTTSSTTPVNTTPPTQSPNLPWDKTFGGAAYDSGNCVIESSDGGLVITGYTSSSGAGSNDVWLIKTDIKGNKLWDKTYGGSGVDTGKSVIQTTDGGYIISGFTTSSGAGNADVWLIKTDSNGNKLWDKTFGGLGSDSGNSIVQSTDGGFVILGYTKSFGAGDYDFWLIKTDSSGNKLWDKTFGGASSELGNSIVQSKDGGYVLTGVTVSYGAGQGDVWLIKTDSNGNKLWDKTLGGTSDEVGYCVIQSADGGFVITGAISSIGNPSDVWLVKTDADGNKLWDKTFGGTGNDMGRSAIQSADGGLVIVGYTNSSGAASDIWVIKTDSSGNKVWDKTYGGNGNDDGYSIIELADGSFVISGITESYGAGFTDLWLIKIDSAGAFPQATTTPTVTTTTPSSPVTTSSTPPTIQLFTPTINGLSVSINGVTLPTTPGASVTTIVWNWGDGYKYPGSFPQFYTYSQAGTYNIVVTATDSNGKSQSALVTVTVK